MDDWLQAERDVLLLPQSGLIEKGGKFNIRVQALGFSAKEIRVTAMADAIVVEGEASRTRPTADSTEIGEKQMFQRLALPAPINPDKVTASLVSGVLQLIAEKAGQAESKAQARAA